jgi:hypothetical protein
VGRAAALLAVLALVGCGSHSSGEEIPAARAKQLVLQPGDLPRGFTSIGGGAQNPFTANDTDPKRFGRTGGWFADYRKAPQATNGPLIVQSQVDVFADSKGAGRELESVRARMRAARSIGAPRMGDESLATKVTGSGAPGALIYTFAWRQRNVVSTVVVSGLRGRLQLSESTALARRAAKRVAG